MSGLFGTFNILKKAMGANQYAINTTTHNISNANTEGYTRQRVEMTASISEGSKSIYTAGVGQLGTGVDIKEIKRVRDEFLDMQIRKENSTLSQYEAKSEFLSEIETMFLEPSDSGMSKYLSNMWDSWQVLSKSPESTNTKTDVVQATLTLTNSINHTFNQLENLEQHSSNLVQEQVYEFNSILKQINDLNRQIKNITISGNNPNDIFDKQDYLIDQLSQKVNISVSRNELKEVEITIGGKNVTGNSITDNSITDNSIIGNSNFYMSNIRSIEKNNDSTYTMTYYNKGDINNPISVKIDEAEYNSLRDTRVIWTDSNGNYEKPQIESGYIYGYSTVYKEIRNYEKQLDAFSRAIAIAVNTVHNDGKTPNEDNYLPIFVASDFPSDESKITAKNITVNNAIKLDPNKIRANGVYEASNASDIDSIGNGDRAIAISQLRFSRIYMNEFYDSPGIISSGIINTDSNAIISSIPAGSTITLKGNGNTSAAINIEGKSLNEIVDEINSIDVGKTEGQKLYIKAIADSGRLIIQSLKAVDNYIDITDNQNNAAIAALRIYDKEDPSYWNNIRYDNTILNNYHPYNKNDASSMRISDDPKGATLLNYFQETITMLGGSSKEAQNMVSSQQMLLEQLEVRKESISGVSMDEEMVNLMQYQRSYQAAAKAVNVVDELLNVIVNGLVR